MTAPPDVRALLAALAADPEALAELRRLMGPPPAVYSTDTLARELGCSPRAVRAAIERGELRARRSGRGWVIGRAAVDEWAAGAAPRERRAPRARARRGLGAALDEHAPAGG